MSATGIIIRSDRCQVEMHKFDVITQNNTLFWTNGKTVDEAKKLQHTESNTVNKYMQKNKLSNKIYDHIIVDISHF